MSVFGTILSKIFPAHHPAVAAQTGNSAPQQQQAATSSGASGTPGAQQQTNMQQPQTGSAPQGAAAGAQQQVDVERVLDDMAKGNSQKLDWRHSIVDLMKLVVIDSSLNARKTLAQELHYTGDTNDSAAMNIWLHKQVMQKLAENGGKVPPDLVRH